MQGIRRKINAGCSVAAALRLNQWGVVSARDVKAISAAGGDGEQSSARTWYRASAANDGMIGQKESPRVKITRSIAGGIEQINDPVWPLLMSCVDVTLNVRQVSGSTSLVDAGIAAWVVDVPAACWKPPIVSQPWLPLRSNVRG